jgi:DNA-directed RNA polymerase subunit omega
MARITVEDCLENEPNRFSLVSLASKRTKQLLTGSNSLIDDRRDNKPVVTSLREVAAGKVRFKTQEEVDKERELELIEAEKAREAEIAALKAAEEAEKAALEAADDSSSDDCSENEGSAAESSDEVESSSKDSESKESESKGSEEGEGTSSKGAVASA